MLESSEIIGTLQIIGCAPVQGTSRMRSMAIQ